MKRLLLAALLLSTSAAAYDPVADTRRILAGTVTTKKVQDEYLSGKRDGTAVFLGAKKAYVAVREAEPAKPDVKVCPNGMYVLAVETCPVEPPPAPVGGYVPSPSLEGGKFIEGPRPAKFLTGWPISPTAAPDVVGAFRFGCTAGPAWSDDPIVYPGQPGRSHRHRSFGRVLTTAAFATYESMRNDPDDKSTCQGLLDATENGTLYWLPELFLGDMAWVFQHVTIYYKRRPANDPLCAGTPNVWGVVMQCVGLPNRVRFIWGYDMLTSTAPTGGTNFGSQATASSAVVKFDNIVSAIEATPVGGRVLLETDAPACWDPRYLDTPNHRDHVSYTYRDGNSGKSGCKAPHTALIPTYRAIFTYEVTEQVKALYGKLKASAPADYWPLRYSCDDAARKTNPALKPGQCVHFDYDENWALAAKQAWIDGSINPLRSSSSGSIGDGRAIPGAGKFVQWVDPAIIANGWLEPLPADIVAALDDHAGH